jgi:hypothetical protein
LLAARSGLRCSFGRQKWNDAKENRDRQAQAYRIPETLIEGRSTPHSDVGVRSHAPMPRLNPGCLMVTRGAKESFLRRDL